jgi:glycerophosphoryl diester phosphodiesterase
VSELSALRRVGHKGADHIAPGNTAASFDAALAAGVDMIEFDVLPEIMERPADSRLVLAHDYTQDLSAALALEEGLAHLASSPFTDIELDVDLKLPGYEARVLEPRLRLGWSYPRAKRDYTASWLYKVPVYAAIGVIRRRLPAAVRDHILAGRCDALMANWLFVTRGLVEAVADAGGELYVWTVDDAKRIRRLEALGVTGVITNDPRLFVMDR